MAELRDFMTVGELAEQVGKTPRALRLYEEMGLLVPRGRSCGNYREYGPDALVRLQWICQLHDLGLPLSEVRGFLDGITQASTAGEAMANLRARYAETLASVEAQIQRLQNLRQGLVESLDWLESCRGCESDVTELRTSCGECERHEGATEPGLVTGAKVQPLETPTGSGKGIKEKS